MISVRNRLLALGAGLALAGCASAPIHYYTLVSPADAPVASGAVTPAAIPFELLPVNVPAQVDQPQLVVRQGGQGMVPLNDQRWIAPLGDEVRSALSAELARDMGAQDVSSLPGNGKPRLRVKLDLRRFDSEPGSYALIDAAWSVRLLHAPHATTLACTSYVREPVGAGYIALVQGHQRAIARLAAQIAGVARSLGAGGTPACPSS